MSALVLIEKVSVDATVLALTAVAPGDSLVIVFGSASMALGMLLALVLHHSAAD